MTDGSSCIAPRWKGAAAPPRAAVQCSDSSDHPPVVRGPGVTTAHHRSAAGTTRDQAFSPPTPPTPPVAITEPVLSTLIWIGAGTE